MGTVDVLAMDVTPSIAPVRGLLRTMPYWYATVAPGFVAFVGDPARLTVKSWGFPELSCQDTWNVPGFPSSVAVTVVLP
jgi:hypothetical protein